MLLLEPSMRVLLLTIIAVATCGGVEVKTLLCMGPGAAEQVLSTANFVSEIVAVAAEGKARSVLSLASMIGSVSRGTRDSARSALDGIALRIIGADVVVPSVADSVAR